MAYFNIFVQGYKTDYEYKLPALKSDKSKEAVVDIATNTPKSHLGNLPVSFTSQS